MLLLGKKLDPQPASEVAIAPGVEPVFDDHHHHGHHHDHSLDHAPSHDHGHAHDEHGHGHSPLKRLINIICPGMVLLSFLFSAGAVWQLAQQDGARAPGDSIYLDSRTAVPHGQWSHGYVLRGLGFLLDPLSSVMILVITGIGFLIHVYSTGYMAHDNGYYRFFGYLNLFVFFMLMLVLAKTTAAVRRLGRRGIMQLPADRILLP